MSTSLDMAKGSTHSMQKMFSGVGFAFWAPGTMQRNRKKA
jgi:hypothetical protein